MQVTTQQLGFTGLLFCFVFFPVVVILCVCVCLLFVCYIMYFKFSLSLFPPFHSNPLLLRCISLSQGTHMEANRHRHVVVPYSSPRARENTRQQRHLVWEKIDTYASAHHPLWRRVSVWNMLPQSGHCLFVKHISWRSTRECSDKKKSFIWTTTLTHCRKTS